MEAGTDFVTEEETTQRISNGVGNILDQCFLNERGIYYLIKIILQLSI